MRTSTTTFTGLLKSLREGDPTRVFADTHYWIAIFDKLDHWHRAAREARAERGQGILVTTDEVLLEVLNAFSGRGTRFREIVCQFVYRLRTDPGVTVLEQSRATFDQGLVLYYDRRDKGYSLIDCISMNTMRQMQIRKVLTNDRHFRQEGFEILMK